MQFVTEMLNHGKVLRDFGTREENGKIEKGSGKWQIYSKSTAFKIKAILY